MIVKYIFVFFSLMAGLHFTYAQKQPDFPVACAYKESKTGRVTSNYDSKANILYSIEVSSVDSNTTLSFASNPINVHTNFSYFTNSAFVQVRFSVHSSIPLDNMLYSLAFDEDSLLQWKKLERNFVKKNAANGDYYTHITLDPIACKNKIFTVKLYNTSYPDVVLQQIVSTVQIEQPILFGNLNGYLITDSVEVNSVRIAKQRQDQKNLENARLSTLDMQEIAGGDFYLNTDNSPYVYSVFLIRNCKEFTDSIPIQFVWGDFKTNIKDFFLSKFKRQAAYNNIYTASIPADLMRRAGTYELLVTPAFMKSSSGSQSLFADKSASIKFEVYQSNLIDASYVIVFSLLFLLLALLFFIWYKRKQRRRLKQQQQQTREAKLKLEAVRFQLNPHFIFNALAGIQNLMNKNEIGKSLDYLSTFSRITRSVLNNSTKELITIDEEIKWLTDYLEMEQLRFGFHYQISVDKNLDKHNIDIPVMLLQPFIENAIKHGIYHLKENGHITISFDRLNNDLQVRIDDNGKGFDTSKEYGGAGLSLSKSRIDLLNTIYTNNLVQLTIDSTTKGTSVIITLKNWL